MFYKNDINTYLSQFNVDSIQYNRYTHQVEFNLHNNNNLEYTYIIDKPLYGVLQSGSIVTYDFPQLLSTDLYDRYIIYLANDTFDIQYFNKHKTAFFGDFYSNEYWNAYRQEEIEELIQLSGLSVSLTDVFGKFILTDDLNLRFLFDPTSIALDDVTNVLESDFYIFEHLNKTYVIYYFICERSNGDLYLIYNSDIVNIVGNTTRQVIDITNKINDINNIHIAYNLYNLCIFENDGTAMTRLPIYTFNKAFFYQITTNLGINSETYLYETFDLSDINNHMSPLDIYKFGKSINFQLTSADALIFKENEIENLVGDILFNYGELNIGTVYYK